MERLITLRMRDDPDTRFTARRVHFNIALAHPTIHKLTCKTLLSKYMNAIFIAIFEK